MSEDLAFRIQLGIILPKLKEKVADSVSEIVGDLVTILKEGTRADEELSLEPIKEIFMKDFEIFLDDSILPDIAEAGEGDEAAEPEEGDAEE